MLTINYIIEEFLLLPAAALKNQSKQIRQQLEFPRLRKLCSLFSVVSEIILIQSESQSCLIYHVIHTVRQLARLMCTPNLHQINITDKLSSQVHSVALSQSEVLVTQNKNYTESAFRFLRVVISHLCIFYLALLLKIPLP